MSKSSIVHHGAVFHGLDKEAAITRAREIAGYVLLSKAPSSEETETYGYWSDPSSFVRTFETLVWRYDEK